jgi:hypothetical protein
MEPMGGMTDVLFGYDTDLHFENGDLMTTTGIDYIEREIYKLLITEPGDWKLNLKLGCSPNTFSGSKNNRETGKRIQLHLTEGLQSTIRPGVVDIRVVPTNYDTVMIFIDLIFPNYLVDTMTFEFDFINGIKKFDKMDPKITEPRSSMNYKINNISNMKRPNQYWEKLRESF